MADSGMASIRLDGRALPLICHPRREPGR